MRRAILSSVLIIGAALAVVFAGGSFSAFTDEEQINGTATAAIVDFELASVTNTGNNTGTTEAAPDEILTLAFDSLSGECSAANELNGGNYFAPGDTCTIAVHLTRANIAQQLAVDLTVSSFDVTGATDIDNTANVIGIDCDGNATADWTITYAFADGDDPGTADDAYMPAATNDPGQNINITVALASTAGGDASAATSCQGNALNTINLTIHAAQDVGDPHNTTDAT